MKKKSTVNKAGNYTKPTMRKNLFNKILDEQKLQKSKIFDRKSAVSFGKLVGVDFIITGSNNDHTNKKTNEGIEHHNTR